VLKTAALEKADFGDERFDKVFAFNVRLSDLLCVRPR
jgi:hypothetical protein